MRSMATRRRNRSTSAMLADALAFLRSRRLRPGDRRDRRHRPERLGDRRPRRPAGLRDDERVRRRQPAREDRHARPRRDRRDQQVRQARRRRTRCATCASSGGATTSRSSVADDEVPVYPTIASQFNDPGLTWMFVDLCRADSAQLPAAPSAGRWEPEIESAAPEPLGNVLIPGNRVRYLAEIAEQGRGINADVEHSATRRRRSAQALPRGRAAHCGRRGRPAERAAPRAPRARRSSDARRRGAQACCDGWDATDSIGITAETYSYTVRDREITGENYRRSLSEQLIPKIAPPRLDGWGDRLRFLMKENLPGSYPYTGGVFPYRREGEDPTRMFAGEGTPERTNRRFHYLSARDSRRRGSRPRSTRSRCTARTRTSGPTSTARSATRASRSRRSTTPRSSTRALTCARRRRRCR